MCILKFFSLFLKDDSRIIDGRQPCRKKVMGKDLDTKAGNGTGKATDGLGEPFYCSGHDRLQFLT